MKVEGLELLCFQVARRTFAVDIMGIREILRAREVTPLPGAPRGVAGVFDLRGDLVHVLDLRARLALEDEDAPPSAEPKMIVVEAAGRRAGLLVDRVLDVVHVPLSELCPVAGAEDSEAGPVVAAFHKAVGAGGAAVVLLVRLGLLLSGGGEPAHGGER
ncbi:MAG: hypothetical protein Kow0092_08950 [Deferrisomatales bacterium]